MTSSHANVPRSSSTCLATAEDLRRYQHLVDHGTSPLSLNAAIAGPQSFSKSRSTAPNGWSVRMHPVRLPARCPSCSAPMKLRCALGHALVQLCGGAEPPGRKLNNRLRERLAHGGTLFRGYFWGCRKRLGVAGHAVVHHSEPLRIANYERCHAAIVKTRSDKSNSIAIDLRRRSQSHTPNTSCKVCRGVSSDTVRLSSIAIREWSSVSFRAVTRDLGMCGGIVNLLVRHVSPSAARYAACSRR
ncbi:hypothetical protein OKW42_001297 [Paraburkholderia sp. WC7.3d]